MDYDRQLEIARCLFRESNDALFVFDPRDLHVVDLNPAALRMSGLTRKAALLLRVEDLFLAGRPKDLQRLIDAFVRTGHLHSNEDYALVRREGEPIPVNVSVSRIHTKPDPLGLIVARDVTARRKVQEDLDRFFRLSPALFGIVGPDRRILKSNPAWEHILGYSAEEIQSSGALDLVHPDDRAATREAVASLARGEVSGFENRCRHKDGGMRWLSWSAATVDGMIYAVALDITERKRAEALQQAQEAAEMASRSKDRFLAVLGHELRAPLNPVLMSVSTLLDDEELAPRLRPTLEMIRRNVAMEARLIEDLLDLSRIGRDSMRLDFRPIDAHESIRQSTESFHGELAADGLELVVDLKAPAHHVRADPARLQQVIGNLIQNAVKFTPAGGTITVRSRNVDAAGDGNGDHPHGARLRLVVEVVDTGMGFEAQILPRIFEAFEQGDDPLRRRSAGLGLGLAISRSLAQAHGGTLTAASPGKGKGSSFTLELPTIPRPDPEVTTATTTARGSPRPMRILLVEDNQDVLRHLALTLGLRGHEVCAVGRMAEALAKATSAGFDLVISDIELPDGNGLDLLRHLGDRAVPAIAMSGYGSEDDVLQSLAAGYHEHLTKPVDIHRLDEAIRRVTVERSADRPGPAGFPTPRQGD